MVRDRFAPPESNLGLEPRRRRTPTRSLLLSSAVFVTLYFSAAVAIGMFVPFDLRGREISAQVIEQRLRIYHLAMAANAALAGLAAGFGLRRLHGPRVARSAALLCGLVALPPLIAPFSPSWAAVVAPAAALLGVSLAIWREAEQDASAATA